MLVGQETTFLQSIIYLCEKQSSSKQLLNRFLVLTRDRQPTLRQLIQGLVTLEIPSNLSLLIQISFLVSVSNISYMTPSNYFEAENLINAVVRILKKEIEEQTRDEFDLRNANPWVLAVSCQFLSHFALHLNTKSDSFHQQVLFVSSNIVKIFNGSCSASFGNNTQGLACQFLIQKAHTELVLFIASISNESDTLDSILECIVDVHMHMMHSLLTIAKSLSLPLKLDFELLLMTSFAQFFCIETHQESIQSKIWEYIPCHRRTTLVHWLWELCISSDSCLLKETIIRLFTSLQIFTTILSMPETCLCILEYILNSWKSTNDILEWNAFMPFAYRFILQIHYSQTYSELQEMEFKNQAMFMDMKLFDSKEAIKILLNSMEIYLNL